LITGAIVGVTAASNAKVAFVFSLPLWFLIMGAVRFVDTLKFRRYKRRAFADTWILYWQFLVLLLAMASHLIPRANRHRLRGAGEIALRLTRCVAMAIALDSTSFTLQLASLATALFTLGLDVLLAHQAAPSWAVLLEASIVACIMLSVLTLYVLQPRYRFACFPPLLSIVDQRLPIRSWTRAHPKRPDSYPLSRLDSARSGDRHGGLGLLKVAGERRLAIRPPLIQTSSL
jgi:hypothetical protein